MEQRSRPRGASTVAWTDKTPEDGAGCVFGRGEVMLQLGPILFMSALGAAVGGFIGYVHGSDATQARWDTEKADTITAQRTKEAELQAGMDKLRTEKNRETAKLQRTVAALTLSLRDRPERPAVPASASAGDGGGWCSGTGLYKSDSEFLIRESARADTLRLALIQCQTAYKKAQQASNER